MKAVERFLKYISIETESDESNEEMTPSSESQWELARLLESELKELGVDDVCVSDHCTVYAHIGATEGMEDKAAFGFIAHMDTVRNGKNIKPRLIPDYDGKDVELESGVILSVKDYPHLPGLKGRTLIVSGGDTILGADDKAGIASIMRMCERVIKEDIPHGPICIAFTPDEEIGNGVKEFDLKLFGADYAVTVDGGEEHVIECENFNAASAKLTAYGVETHPGSAKGVMINAASLIAEVASSLPKDEVPECTEDREGFYHLTDMQGNVEEATASYILRDFDKDNLEKRKQTMIDICNQINKRYDKDVIKLEIKDSYSNMKQIMDENKDFLNKIEEAISAVGMTPEYLPIRGGTDGCQLSYLGLPCPNLGAGAYGFHGFTEHCSAEGMEICAEVLIKLL